MTTKQLWNIFNKKNKTEQIVILKEYASYAGNFDELSGVPVCFLEWWTNDYEFEGSGINLEK